MQCQIYILMKKVIILEKMQVTMKTSLPFFSHLNLSLNRKKCVISAADSLQIRIGNLNWCHCGHCKNETGEIDCLYCREVDAMLFASAKIPEHRKYLALQLLWTTARLLVTCVSLICLVDVFFFLFQVQRNEMRILGESKILSFCF